VDVEARTFCRKIDEALKALSRIPGVTAVKSYPEPYTVRGKLNANGIKLKLELDGVARHVNVHCSNELSDKLLAAEAAKKKITSLLGSDVVSAAEQGRPVQSLLEGEELTTDELQWLSEWCAQQSEAAGQATLDQAQVALNAHRSAVRAPRPSAFAVLFKARWLKAKVQAAEIRMQKASQELANLKKMLMEEVAGGSSQNALAESHADELKYWERWSEKEWKRQEAMCASRRAHHSG